MAQDHVDLSIETELESWADQVEGFSLEDAALLAETSLRSGGKAPVQGGGGKAHGKEGGIDVMGEQISPQSPRVGRGRGGRARGAASRGKTRAQFHPLAGKDTSGRRDEGTRASGALATSGGRMGGRSRGGKQLPVLSAPSQFTEFIKAAYAAPAPPASLDDPLTHEALETLSQASAHTEQVLADHTSQIEELQSLVDKLILSNNHLTAEITSQKKVIDGIIHRSTAQADIDQGGALLGGGSSAKPLISKPPPSSSRSSNLSARTVEAPKMSSSGETVVVGSRSGGRKRPTY